MPVGHGGGIFHRAHHKDFRFSLKITLFLGGKVKVRGGAPSDRIWYTFLPFYLKIDTVETRQSFY